MALKTFSLQAKSSLLDFHVVSLKIYIASEAVLGAECEENFKPVHTKKILSLELCTSAFAYFVLIAFFQHHSCWFSSSLPFISFHTVNNKLV